MNPAFVTVLNGIILVVFSLYGYLNSDTPSFTALIPAAFGLLFVLAYPFMKKDNKIVAHIVVVLTLVLIIALFKPLTGAIGREDTMAIVRVAIMLGCAVLAFIVYIRSFTLARRNKA